MAQIRSQYVPEKICSPILNYAFALNTCDSYILDIINNKYRGKGGSRKHFFKKSWKLMFLLVYFFSIHCDILPIHDYENHPKRYRFQFCPGQQKILLLRTYLKCHRRCGFIVISWQTDSITIPCLPNKTHGGEAEKSASLPPLPTD